jgi:Zn-dependent peptidase ImmA (M78 family)
MSMTETWKDLAQQAQAKALEVRRKSNLDPKLPICVYDICEKLGDLYEGKEVTVQFARLSGLEGMYINEEKERRILVSSCRPLPRKTFTCAHELGHHLFNHGLKADQLEEAATGSQRDPQEFLVDCFAGFLLMPAIAVRYAFTIRGWSPATATPQQVFTVACSFGVGYNTLIDHMTYTLKLISQIKARELKKASPKTIRQNLLEELSSKPLIIADEQWLLKTVDVEVGYQLLLPKTVLIEGDIISFQASFQESCLFRADRQGVARAYCPDSDWAAFIRVSRFEYTGFSEFRHTEGSDDE